MSTGAGRRPGDATAGAGRNGPAKARERLQGRLADLRLAGFAVAVWLAGR